jgi:Predicted transcriptional regulators
LGEMTMKQNKEKFDFKAFGQAIKAARKAKGISRNQLADTLNIAPRYIASIENSGQHPSLQILYELVTLLDVSVDQFFFPVTGTGEIHAPPSARYYA